MCESGIVIRRPSLRLRASPYSMRLRGEAVIAGDVQDRERCLHLPGHSTEEPGRRATLFRTRSDVPGLIAPLARV